MILQLLRQFRIWLLGDPFCELCVFHHSGDIHPVQEAIKASLTIKMRK